MKKYLPQINNQKAFTLIELLVVIAIIAIISVVAVSLFSNVQSDARDGKRRAELESIANVLEVNKQTAGYVAPQAANFGGGNFPGGSTTRAMDPSNYPYCIAAPTAADPVATNFTTTPTCTATGFALIDGTAFTSTNQPSYKICTRLENRGTATVFCRTNVQ